MAHPEPGRPLIAALLERGHRVRALVRPGSEHTLPAGAQGVFGAALDAGTWCDAMSRGDTLVHLVGTPHPSPSKAQQFLDVDLASIEAATHNAVRRGASHIVYVSVAHPAPMMQAYVDARKRGESLVRATGIPATILRPWYVLGPGHRWPMALPPVYGVLARIPATKDGAIRLGLVTRAEMLAALRRAVEAPPDSLRVMNVPEIRQCVSA
jgi:uncharacterized protein YbjT (DUF2867 family)